MWYPVCETSPQVTKLVAAAAQAALLCVAAAMVAAVRFFGDWLNWLCSGWNQQSAQAAMERTLQEICKQLQAEGVSQLQL